MPTSGHYTFCLFVPIVDIHLVFLYLLSLDILSFYMVFHYTFSLFKPFIVICFVVIRFVFLYLLSQDILS
jgi:hypothetical protein